MITRAYQSRCSSRKPSSKARITWDFSTLSKINIKHGTEVSSAFIKQSDAIWNRISDHFDKRPTSQTKTQWTNQPRITEESWWHFVHPEERVKNITRWHRTLSPSAIGKQVSRCSINFLHEFTAHQSEHKNWTWNMIKVWPWWEK